MSRRGRRPPTTIRLDRLEAGGLSGTDESGRRLTVRNGAVGDALLVVPGRGGEARILQTLSRAPDAVTPRCPVFGVCGGCQLQTMSLERQREEKAALVSRLVDFPSHPSEGGEGGYGYRNKLELSFGRRRYVSDMDRALAPQDEPLEDLIGFHPPGWFGKIVPLVGCPLATPAMNAALEVVVEARPGPAWDNRAHVGRWRHVVLRQGEDGVLVTLVTTSDTPEEEVRAIAAKLASLAEVAGVLWITHDGVAEVASGELRAVLHGTDGLRLRLGDALLHLPHDAFFQVNLAGAERLVARVGDALFGQGGARGGTLLDLYCGVGALGVALAPRLEGGAVLGVELHAPSIEIARANARACAVTGAWHAGPVEEVLPTLTWAEPAFIVVDPPRAGLHPRAARFLADARAEALVYVACNPASLGRDRPILEAGGWRLTDLWTVDLFPQTRHVEAIGRFVRA